MPTTVVIPPPVNVDVDEEDSPHVFDSITSSPFDPPEWDDDGKLVVHFPDVDLTDAQVVAIINLAQENPPPEPVAPVAPDESNTPEVSAVGIGALGLKVEPVENATSVMYDFYLSDSTPVAIDTGHLLTSTPQSFVVTAALADGTALVAGTTYYCAVQTRSGAEMGPVSAEGSGTPRLVTGPDIAAETITGANISGNTITGEKFAGVIIVSGTFTTAESGERDGISATEGHFSYGPDGELTFQAQGGNAYFDGTVNARTLNVVEGATWSGSNVGSPGASTMMGNALGPPANAPTVEAFWDTITLDGGDVAGDDQSKRRGLVWYDSHWWVASHDGSNGMTLRFDAAGDFVDAYMHSGIFHEPASLTLLSGYLWFKPESTVTSVVYRIDPSDRSTTIVPLASTTAQMRAGVLGSDGTNLILAWVGSAENLNWQKYTTVGATSGSQVSTGVAVLAPTAVLGGSFDYGASRVLVGNGGTVAAFNTTGSPQTTHSFMSPSVLGLTWDGSIFAALSSPTSIRLHTDALVGETFAFFAEYVTSTWYDSAGTTHETMRGGTTLRTFYQRAKHRLRTSAKVPTVGGADDPNGARFYVGRTNANAKLERQGVDSPGAGNYAELELADVTLPSGTNNAANPPPTTGNFPIGTAYRHYSEAVDSAGNPLVEIRGDGYAGGEGLIPVGTIWMYMGLTAPAGWLICNGGSFSGTTYPKLQAFLAGTTLPDFRSRFPVGAGSYASLWGDEGDAEASRTTAHNHTGVTGAPNQKTRRVFEAGANNTPGENHDHNIPSGGGPGDFPHLGVSFMIRAT